jgi:hypothetical protein
VLCCVLGTFFVHLAHNCDEVKTFDSQSWVLIHAYIIEDWVWSSIIYFLECITKGGNANNLTNIIMDTLMNDGDLFKFDIIMKLLSFGIDGMNVFQVRFLVFTIFVSIGFCSKV